MVRTRQGIVWHAERERVGDTALAADLVCLLEGIRLKRFPRPSLFAALGPTLAQVKHLRELPPVDSPRVVRQLIEASPSRFFLAGDSVPVVAEPMRGTDGWWVAVADADVVAAIDALCERRGWRHGGVRPAEAVLPRALASTLGECSMKWSDGSTRVEVTVKDQRFIAITRARTQAVHSSESDCALDTPLENVGSGAWRLAAAYGAARADASAPLVLRLRREGEVSPQHVARRIASITLVMLGAAIMLAAPGVVATRSQEHDDRAIEALHASATEVARDRSATAQLASALRQVSAFAASRRLMTPLLSSLSEQLPESTAIIALRLDTLGGTIVTLSLPGTAIVSAVSDTPGLDGLQLSAPITSETIGPLDLQRIAVRFRFRRHGSSSMMRRP